jgi:hypothetical protein
LRVRSIFRAARLIGRNIFRLSVIEAHGFPLCVSAPLRLNHSTATSIRLLILPLLL